MEQNHERKNCEVTDEQLIKDNQVSIIYESSQNIKLLRLRAGDKLQSQFASYRHLNMINNPWGSRIISFNKPQHALYVLKPKATLITETLTRKTQILYNMDNAAIIFKLNLTEGLIVVEAGTGSGSLSCAISECIGNSGHLFTFEFNKERAQSTKELFQKLQIKNITINQRDVVKDGFNLTDQNIAADALFLDVPNPWAALHSASKVLKKYGKICCFSPCIEQVQKTCQQMKKLRFKRIQTQQCLVRELHHEPKQLETISQGKRSFQSRENLMCTTSIRNNRGHTGFLTFAVVV